MGVKGDLAPFPPRLLERVAASAAGIRAGDGLWAHVEQLAARGRSTTLEYRLEGGLRLIAKRYAQRGDALASCDVLCGLRAQGFGPGSRHRVAEPLGCFPDWGVLLMRVAAGDGLQGMAARSRRWEDGLRAAAAWLAQLHALPVEPGAPADMTQGVFRLARQATMAGAHHPELRGLLVRLIEELSERAGSVVGSLSQAQTHGRFHQGHVFVAPEAVTVIDLDRAALADPAKDVGEFLHRVREQARRARLGVEGADRATLVFLEEYVAHAEAVPGGLVYYWSCSVLSTLLRVVELDPTKWQKRLEFHRAEFDAVPRRVSNLSGLVG